MDSDLILYLIVYMQSGYLNGINHSTILPWKK